ncbi:MAG: hypothetical protein PHV11_06010 [Candidatus Bipolaricaulis sp.]|nr:hypothetical protein [Candidatus Bipolaricaulis sp.]MDD5646800.1 hypothetical protein [Candidatus Bipolaricaulis sp.]
MFDTYRIYSAAARVVEDRMAEAERLRQIHRTQQQRKAWNRLTRAMELGLRHGLDQGELAHELSTRLGEEVRD